MPPLMGQVASGGGLDTNAQGTGAGGDTAKQGIEQVMSAIRDLGQQVQQIGSLAPSLASDVQQIQQIMKRMIVKAAQQAPQQTPSAQALPGGG